MKKKSIKAYKIFVNSIVSLSLVLIALLILLFFYLFIIKQEIYLSYALLPLAIVAILFGDFYLIRKYKSIFACRCKCGYNYAFPDDVKMRVIYTNFAKTSTQSIQFECKCKTCGSIKYFEREFCFTSSDNVLKYKENIETNNGIEYISPDIYKKICKMFSFDDSFEIPIQDNNLEFNQIYDESNNIIKK